MIECGMDPSREQLAHLETPRKYGPRTKDRRWNREAWLDEQCARMRAKLADEAQKREGKKA